MKSCKSTLRKAAMAAMLAGAITTTGGVKAETVSKKVEDAVIALASDNSDTVVDKLVDIFSELTANEMSEVLTQIYVEGDVSKYNKAINSFQTKLQINTREALDAFIGAMFDSVNQRIISEASLKKDKAELQDDLNKAIKVSTDLMNQLGTAKEARDKAQAEADRLSQAVDSLGRLTNSAKRELTEKLAEIDQLTVDKAKAASDLETANANITTLQEEIAGAKASYDKLSEDKAAADQVLAEANARVSNLEQEVAAANNRVADLEAQLAAKTAELDVVKADKAELEAKVKELQSLLEQKDRSNADLQANIERLKQELADKFKDQAQPRAKTPQASNSAAKQKASKPTAKPAGQLPSTGEATANPFFTAAAVAIMTGAGLVTVMPKRQKN
ncbi:TPA: LPXTG cell wall anchor domain-containing protein [Streptococcus equi subsp. zooepidemicus]|uniref:LPXTG cell wall anchor domain-containing protein n=1 Tax=Streptococcus equi TaxID=1336 RepID=UPI001E3ACF2D|nr:LPXTG cell wall anchor domain-containing protein [Streptococcus equi]UFR18941.1 LPXTG cell wall anchor domain-containing protein [Streptococcus equi subsp. zooepidemicus]HEL0007877.1 LPXTG cell wall anchor domain-containing protein [Streptococcus equi subsp. zooepidemicus]HEL0115068.1 LPXTG cell wall anchor domain-containing protein [Streptococcus equi subsp. zooepidemicus]HEL0117103.1 LPXTG cell wall anchor domain-containing protein [Streptococcus equi subsp. zooepidemicus]HEL0119069.1 LPX